MIRAESAFMLCVLVAAVAVVFGHWLGQGAGYRDGHEDGYQQAVAARQPMPPATICKLRLPSSKYKQLDCPVHAWRKP